MADWLRRSARILITVLLLLCSAWAASKQENKLPPRYRDWLTRDVTYIISKEEKDVFLLRQNGELTYEQIAEVRGCPVSTVKTQMRTALEKIRKVLN